VGAAGYWRCPICLRRVPGKVAECYCGRKRQPGDGPDEPETAAASSTAWLTGALVAILGVALFVGLRPRASAPSGPPASTARPEATAAAREPAAEAPPGHARQGDVPGFTGPTPRPTARVEEPAAIRSPQPRPTPTPEDSVDARREQGRLAFENAMRNLQGRAEVLARRLDNLARTCPPEATRVIGCDALREEIARDAGDIRSAADEAVEAARRGWVDPGSVRDARERYGLREGDILALLRRVDEALAR
jgi:hypothetical protein